MRPPAHAIPADEAARLILAGVSNNEGIIVLPESARELWLGYRRSPDESEKFLRDLARQRRNSILSTGSYY